jgi:hypothetical protein
MAEPHLRVEVYLYKDGWTLVVLFMEPNRSYLGQLWCSRYEDWLYLEKRLITEDIHRHLQNADGIWRTLSESDKEK